VVEAALGDSVDGPVHAHVLRHGRQGFARGIPVRKTTMKIENFRAKILVEIV